MRLSRSPPTAPSWTSHHPWPPTQVRQLTELCCLAWRPALIDVPACLPSAYLSSRSPLWRAVQPSNCFWRRRHPSPSAPAARPGSAPSPLAARWRPCRPRQVSAAHGSNQMAQANAHQRSNILKPGCLVSHPSQTSSRSSLRRPPRAAWALSCCPSPTLRWRPRPCPSQVTGPSSSAAGQIGQARCKQAPTWLYCRGGHCGAARRSRQVRA